MFPTAEVRWFFRDEPFPPSLLFDTSNAPSQRTDWYAPAGEHSGVKFREGRLEVKLRVASLGERAFKGARGHVEGWQKWSVEMPLGDRPSEKLLHAAGWIGVTKLRHLRTFAIDGTAICQLDRLGGSGVQLEWTKLTVCGENVSEQTWWTVGFESSGPPVELDRNLTLVADHVFASNHLPAIFRGNNSCGYSHWLGQLESARC
jgi:hypothetical protein